MSSEWENKYRKYWRQLTLHTSNPTHNRPSFQFTIPTNYTYGQSARHTKDIPWPISQSLSYIPRIINSSYQTKPGQSVYLRKYTARYGREGKKKQWGGKVQLRAISLPLIRTNGGLERILQKFPLNPHNISENLPLRVTANSTQPTA